MIIILENFSIQHPERNATYRFEKDAEHPILNQTGSGITVSITGEDEVWEGQVEVPRVLEGETFEVVKR